MSDVVPDPGSDREEAAAHQGRTPRIQRGRHHQGVGAHQGRREGARAGFRGRCHQEDRRRQSRVVHRPQGELRRRRRARLPAAHAAHREDRGHCPWPRAPRPPLLLPRSRRQGGSHQGQGGHLGGDHRAGRRRPTSSRPRRSSSAAVMSRALGAVAEALAAEFLQRKAIASSTATGPVAAARSISSASTATARWCSSRCAPAPTRATAHPLETISI